MPTSSTSQLRQVLDTLRLDPGVMQDREYLISVLRRIGYTDHQIEAELGIKLTADERTADGAEEMLEAGARVVEIEYLGGEITEYEPVYRSEHALAEGTAFTLAEGGEGEGVSFSAEGDDVEVLDEAAEIGDDELTDEWADDWGDYEGPPPEEEGELLEFAEVAPELEFREIGAFPQEGWTPGSGERGPWTTFEVGAGAAGGPGAQQQERHVRVKVVHAADREEAIRIAREQGLDAIEAVPLALQRHKEGAEGAAQAWPQQEAWGPGEEGATSVPDWPEQTEEIPDWPAEEAAVGDEVWPQEEAAPDALPQETESEWPAEETTAGDDVWQEEEAAPQWPSEEAVEGGDVWPEEGGQDWPAEESVPEWTPPETTPRDEAGPADLDAPAPSEGEPFQYNDYTLYTREVQLGPERTQRIYFFAKTEPASGVSCALPPGYAVKENERTGLPYLTREG